MRNIIFFVFLIFLLKLSNQFDYKNYDITTGQKNLLSLELYNGYYLTSLYYDERISSIRLIIFGRGWYTAIPRYTCRIIYKSGIDELCDFNYTHIIEEHRFVHFLTVPMKYDDPDHLLINNITIPLYIVEYKPTEKYHITLCISKMINYNCPYSFIQMIEANRVFGVDHVMVYKTNCSEEMEKVLNYYEEQGIMEVITWNKTIEFIGKRYAYAQKIKIVDCFYRNRRKTEDMINTDSDEIVWPVIADNYTGLLKYIDDTKGSFDLYILYEKIFKRNIVDQNDRFAHNIEDCNFFDYRENADFTTVWPKYYLRGMDKALLPETHIVIEKEKIKKCRTNKRLAYVRHTRRVSKQIMEGIRSKWVISPKDSKEDIIQARVEKIRQLLDIPYPSNNRILL